MNYRLLFLGILLLGVSGYSYTQEIGNVGAYYSVNVDELKHRNITGHLYNLKNDIAIICEWSYRLDEKKEKFNESDVLCFEFNKDKAIDRRIRRRITSGKSYESVYQDYKNNVVLSTFEKSKEGYVFSEKHFDFEKSVPVGIRQNYGRSGTFEFLEYEKSQIGDTVVVNTLSELKYFVKGVLVQEILPWRLHKYFYDSSGHLICDKGFKDGMLVSQDSFNNNGLLVFRLKSKFNKNKEFESGSIKNYVYKNGQVQEVHQYHKIGEESYREMEFYIYDNRNKLVAIENGNDDFQVNNGYFSYNEKGDILRYDYDGREFHFENYKYDKKGNWIYREKIQRSARSYEVREFTYVK